MEVELELEFAVELELEKCLEKSRPRGKQVAVENSHFSQTRESMRVLPRGVQSFLTWLTGRPLMGEKCCHHSNFYHLGTSLVTLISGEALVVLALMMRNFFSLPLILLGMILVTSAMRKLQIVIVHHLSHGNFFGRKDPRNFYLGRLLSFLLIIEPFDSYKKHHTQDHHFIRHMTEDDPTVIFLFRRVGLRPGLSVKEAKRQFIRSFFNPMFYLEAFWQRLKEQGLASKAYQVAMLSFWSGVMVASITSGNALPLLWGWFIPLIILYPISSALRLMVEHTFPVTQKNRKFDLLSMTNLTNAVFCGEKFPVAQLSFSWGGARAISWWSWRMLTYHLFFRVFVLVGDTPVHDHHHRFPLYGDWANYAFARQEALVEGASPSEEYEMKAAEKLKMEPYWEVWGYGQAFDHSLTSLSEANWS